MAVSAGNPDSGAFATAALASSTAAVIWGPRMMSYNEPHKVLVRATATGAFRLNYLYTPDNGTTWLIGKQVASGTVTVDGGTASYVAAAVIEETIGYEAKVEIYNPGASINWGAEVRVIKPAGP